MQTRFKSKQTSVDQASDLSSDFNSLTISQNEIAPSINNKKRKLNQMSGTLHQ